MGEELQQLRARRIAIQLGAGPNPAQGLVKALQALVEADEKYIKDAPPKWRRPPPPEPVTPPVTPQVITPAVITEPEKELTLF